MLSNIIGCKVDDIKDDIKIEMPVEVVFEDITDEFVYLSPSQPLRCIW